MRFRLPFRSLIVTLTVIAAIVPAILSTSAAQAEERLEASEVTVNALTFYTSAAGRGEGICVPLHIEVGGREPGRVRIGFFESEVGGTGDKWQAAGWMASLIAAQLTDFNPSTMQVSYEVQARIDGPSAGGLMTVGILAAVRGDEVRSDVAMTGTINPDGMIGPVGGIPHKLEGAAAAGMKTVIIPATAETEIDKNTGEYVHLIRRGEELGLEVKPVIDIYEAYSVMTGKELPRPNIPGKPTIDFKTDAVLAARIGAWSEMTTGAIEKYKETAEEHQVEYSDLLIEEAESYMKSSTKLLKEGVVTVAYTDLQYAAMNAFLAKEVAYCNQTNLTLGYTAMVDRSKNNAWLQSEVEKTAVALKFSQPTTLNQLALYLGACDAFIEAVAYQKLAANTLARLPEEPTDADLEVAITASEWQVMSWLDLKVTMDFLELMRQYGGKPIPADAPFLETAHFYRRTADASLRVFESITVRELADALNVGDDLAKMSLSRKDEYFGIVTTAQAEVMPNLEEYFGDGPQYAYATLAGSMFVHLRASMLIAKYYSLNAELNDQLQIVGVGREQALNEWLAASEEQARQNIMLLSKYGIDTATCAQNFEYCHLMSTRSMWEKLDSLTVLLYLNTLTKVMQRLSGVKVDEDTGLPETGSVEVVSDPAPEKTPPTESPAADTPVPGAPSSDPTE